MKAKKTMEMKEVLEDIRNKPTVPLWPHLGMALGVSRNTLYEAAVSGDIDCIKVGRSIRASRRHSVRGSAWIRTPHKKTPPLLRATPSYFTTKQGKCRLELCLYILATDPIARIFEMPVPRLPANVIERAKDVRVEDIASARGLKLRASGVEASVPAALRRHRSLCPQRHETALELPWLQEGRRRHQARSAPRRAPLSPGCRALGRHQAGRLRATAARARATTADHAAGVLRLPARRRVTLPAR